MDVEQLDRQLGGVQASGADAHQDEGRLDQEDDVGVLSLDALDGVAAVGHEGDERLHQTAQADHHVLLAVQAEDWLPGLAQHENVLLLRSEHVEAPVLQVGAALGVLELLLIVRAADHSGLLQFFL